MGVVGRGAGGTHIATVSDSYDSSEPLVRRDTMPGILAIEADPTRKRLLRALVREHVNVEITIADSVSAALIEIDRRLPDVILVPVLLPPSDAEELMARVHAKDAPYVQMLALPAFDMLAAPVARQKRFFDFIKKPPTEARSLYDRSMVGTHIADAVAHARQARAEYTRLLSEQAENEEPTKEWGDYESDVSVALVPKGTVFDDGFKAERRAARRQRLREIPWLSAVTAAAGSRISVVNISSSGVLLASPSKFAPGSTTELHLAGPDTNLIVPVRFVRSEIAKIDPVGVLYHAAATFEREIDLALPCQPLQPLKRTLCAPQALAELLTTTLADSQSSEPAHARFTWGLKGLIGARDVQISTAPGSSGRDTLYFTVPGDDRALTTLQVRFDRGHDVTPEEFKLLKAAAWLTAAALELEKLQAGREFSAVLEEQVA
jgi:CheY-like chemotaxis protein